MGIPGRKPKPVEQRLREGKDDPGRQKLPDPVIVAGRPTLEELKEPPEHIPEEAKDFWAASIVRLAEVGILDRVDQPTLELLATQYARARQAARVVERQGMFVKGSVGQLREHPAVKIEREATDKFLKLCEHFAMTPVARTRLGIAELHRRSMEADLDEEIGPPKLTPA